jgi:Short C-terminal domain
MSRLSPEGHRVVEDVARRTGFSPDAVTSMLFSVMAGRGGMAQFNHPEFGGSGQWMSGGAIMISDMFNNVLKARVDTLCNELSALVRDQPGIAGAGPFQLQRQGKPAGVNVGLASLLAPEASREANWWPEDLGSPSSTGAQNDVRYAYFPAARRLAIELNGKVRVYDTQDHQIGGFSQQQSGLGSLSFASQLGPVDVSRLPVVEDRASSEPIQKAAAERSGAAGDAVSRQQDTLATIERLGELQARGILTDAEFSAKKAELLSRILAGFGPPRRPKAAGDLLHVSDAARIHSYTDGSWSRSCDLS